MPPISRRWVFTVNNYTDENINTLNSLEVQYLIYGREVAASGTPHLQGFVTWETNKRFQTVKGLLPDGAHIEAARGTSQQAAQYCKKDGDFTERGQCPVNSGKRTDWDRYKDWVMELGRMPTRDEVIREHTGLWARYSKSCFDVARVLLPTPVLTPGQPRAGWQRELQTALEQEPDERSIRFYVDELGNAGKSWFCRWCMTNYPEETQILRIGKRDDLAHAIDCSKTIFLFDIPRNQMIYLQYSVLEMLKDRMIFSPKYESNMKILAQPVHVIVFSNEQPDRDALTNDRYRVTHIRNL